LLKSLLKKEEIDVNCWLLSSTGKSDLVSATGQNKVFLFLMGCCQASQQIYLGWYYLLPKLSESRGFYL
jgi:hypothetical protein